MKFYRIFFPENSYFGIGEPEDEKDRNFEVPYLGSIENWQPISLKLKNGGFADYQGANPVYRLCSEKLMNIFERNKSPDDKIQWLPMKVKDNYGEIRPYYILHFTEIPEVLDKERSIILNENQIIKPVFSLEKIATHKVFCWDPYAFLGIIVSEDIKNKIEEANCTNLDFGRVPITSFR